MFLVNRHRNGGNFTGHLETGGYFPGSVFEMNEQLRPGADIQTESAIRGLTPSFVDQLDSVTDMTDFAVAVRYPESDQWIDDCDPSEWMVIVERACDFVLQKMEA